MCYIECYVINNRCIIINIMEVLLCHVLEEFPLLFLTKLTVVLCMVLREGVHILGNV